MYQFQWLNTNCPQTHRQEEIHLCLYFYASKIYLQPLYYVKIWFLYPYEHKNYDIYVFILKKVQE